MSTKPRKRRGPPKVKTEVVKPPVVNPPPYDPIVEMAGAPLTPEEKRQLVWIVVGAITALCVIAAAVYSHLHS